MRVALVFNQKKEDARQYVRMDEKSKPPGGNGGASATSINRTSESLSTQHISDLYAEWDSPETIEAVRSALAEVHDVTLVEADENACERLRQDRPQIVFNMSEGLYGISREAQIPAILELLQIPYTGSDPLTLATCLDKSRAKEILSYYQVPTPAFRVISHVAELRQRRFSFPQMVKPLHEGSSKGVFNSSVVSNAGDLEREVFNILERYQEPALVEEYLGGREFTVALLGNGNGVTVLPIVEIRFGSLPEGVNPIYSYEAKWIWDTADNPLDIFSCPADITPSLRESIEKTCVQAYHLLRCRDWCRIDVRLDARGIPHILELNPLPGILPDPDENSCFPKAARAAGIGYSQLIQTVLSLAAVRTGVVAVPMPSFQETP
ncbi:MAG TPA: D-alanine--D-alanine ligase [Bacteroidota bacterium]|nr:D-alanine--D-alanine ligase [Bacteroidota bacterium]